MVQTRLIDTCIFRSMFFIACVSVLSVCYTVQEKAKCPQSYRHHIHLVGRVEELSLSQ